MFGIRAPVDGEDGRGKPLGHRWGSGTGALPRETITEGTDGSGRSGETDITDGDSNVLFECERN